MMLSIGIKTSVLAYLERIAQLTAGPLGEPVKLPDREDSAFLLSRMKQDHVINGISKLSAIAMLLVTFALFIFLAVHYRNDVTNLLRILGGNVLTLLLVVAWMRKIWLEGTMLAMLTVVTEKLPPVEAAKVITSVYYKMIKADRSYLGMLSDLLRKKSI